MTPSQTQALQDVKDEVAKKHGYRNLLSGIFERNKPTSRYTVTELVDEVAELYHTRLLAEAGKAELPNDEQAKKHWTDTLQLGNCTHREAFFDAYDWMHAKASALLAAKQAEIDAYEKWGIDVKELTKEIDVIMNGKDAAKQAALCDVVSQLASEYPKLRSQLEAAQKEIERLRERINDLNQ